MPRRPSPPSSSTSSTSSLSSTSSTSSTTLSSPSRPLSVAPQLEGLRRGSTEWTMLQALRGDGFVFRSASALKQKMGREFPMRPTIAIPPFVLLQTKMRDTKDTGCRTMVCLPTGSGKSTIAVGLAGVAIQELCPFIFCTPRTALCDEFVTKMQQLFKLSMEPQRAQDHYYDHLMKATSLLYYGSKKDPRLNNKDFRPLTVICQPTLQKRLAEIQEISPGILVIDEAHVLPTSTNVIAERFASLGWRVVALTATPSGSFRARGSPWELMDQKMKMADHYLQKWKPDSWTIYKELQYINFRLSEVVDGTTYRWDSRDRTPAELEEMARNDKRFLVSVMKNTALIVATVKKVATEILPPGQNFRRILIRVATISTASTLETELDSWNNQLDAGSRFDTIGCVHSGQQNVPKVSRAQEHILVSALNDSREPQKSVILIIVGKYAVGSHFEFARCCLDATVMEFNANAARQFMARVAVRNSAAGAPYRGYVISCPLLGNEEFMRTYVEEHWPDQNRFRPEAIDTEVDMLPPSKEDIMEVISEMVNIRRVNRDDADIDMNGVAALPNANEHDGSDGGGGGGGGFENHLEIEGEPALFPTIFRGLRDSNVPVENFNEDLMAFYIQHQPEEETEAEIDTIDNDSEGIDDESLMELMSNQQESDLETDTLSGGDSDDLGDIGDYIEDSDDSEGSEDTERGDPNREEHLLGFRKYLQENIHQHSIGTLMKKARGFLKYYHLEELSSDPKTPLPPSMRTERSHDQMQARRACNHLVKYRDRPTVVTRNINRGSYILVKAQTDYIETLSFSP